ncbi:MAG: tetratricopeptide repeat protein [Gammaproteobacteria bacterium]
MKVLRVLAGLLALAWLAAAWSGSAQHKVNGGIPLSDISDEAYKLAMHAQDRLDLADFWTSNRAAREAVEVDPDSLFAWISLANASASFPEFSEAIKKASALKSTGTRGEQLWIDLNATFLDNNAEKRLQLAEALVGEYPESPRAWVILAGVQTGRGSYADARKSNDKAIELDSHMAAAYTANGFSYMFNQPVDANRSETYMARAAKLRPEEASVWINLGDSYRAQSKLADSREAYTKAMNLNGKNEVAPIKRGHVNSFLGNFEEARADYDKGVELGQASAVPNLANYRAFVNLYADDPKGAVVELEGVLKAIDDMDMADDEKNGTRIFTLQNMATICFHSDMTDDAENAIARLTAAYTANADASNDAGVARQMTAGATYWEGRLAAREGDFETAVGKAEKYAEILKDDQNPRRMENYHDLLGLVNLLQGNYNEAIAHYNKANLDPSGGIWSKYHLAVALDKADRKTEAGELFSEVANYNFNSVGFALVRKDAGSRT